MGLSALLPAESPTEDQPAKTLGRYGCEFNQGHAALVINMTAAVLRGFLAHFSTFFPAGTPPEPLELERRGLVDVLSSHTEFTIKGEMLSLWVTLTA